MIRAILVALDTSARAVGVFDTAAAMAAKFGAELHVFRAVSIPAEFPAPSAGSHDDPLPKHVGDLARTDLLTYAERAPAGVTVKLRVEASSQPWRAILGAADELDVDLVVLGSHAYGAADRLLGTTAARVVNHATRNVLVVHRHTDADRASRDPSTARIL